MSKIPNPEEQVLLPFPAEGVEFELTLDGDTVDPLEMVRKDVYTGAWEFNGPKVVGKQTRKFKLLPLATNRTSPA